MSEEKFSLLSDKAILHNIEVGNVVIEPFVRGNLSTSSYDVTLGEFYYRENTPEPGQGIYNPYSETMVQRVWGHLREAEKVSEWYKRSGGVPLENISDDDRIIWISPGMFFHYPISIAIINFQTI